jgi:hypothetical protein
VPRPELLDPRACTQQRGAAITQLDRPRAQAVVFERGQLWRRPSLTAEARPRGNSRRAADPRPSSQNDLYVRSADEGQARAQLQGPDTEGAVVATAGPRRPQCTPRSRARERGLGVGAGPGLVSCSPMLGVTQLCERVPS